MTFIAGTAPSFVDLDRRRPSFGLSAQSAIGTVLLGAAVVVGAWALATRPFDSTDSGEQAAVPAPRLATRQATPHPSPASRMPAPQAPMTADVTVRVDSAMLDPTFAAGLAAMAVVRDAPLDPHFRSASATADTPPAEPEHVVPLPPPAPVVTAAGEVPLPTPRPTDLDAAGPVVTMSRGSGRQFSPQRKVTAAPAAAADNRSLFDRLFGIQAQPAGPALAYAAPEPTALSRANPLRDVPGPAPDYDKLTAVYDISAHTVYLPDGSTLEAHSGLGTLIDDPASVHVRDRGATPPHVYDLTPREQLFHGVKALRLNPVGGGGVFGRAGLLAHTFMLGPNGQSNGCVSFRNYDAFLRAYENGTIRRLAVVARR